MVVHHLPGKHDQKSHGRRYQAGPVGGRAAVPGKGDTPATAGGPGAASSSTGSKGVVGTQVATDVLRSVDLRTPQEKDRDFEVKRLREEMAQKVIDKAARKPKGKKVLEDDPEASALADKLHDAHVRRTAVLRDPLEVQASYEKYKKDLADAGVVPTATGYTFKKGKKPATVELSNRPSETEIARGWNVVKSSSKAAAHDFLDQVERKKGAMALRALALDNGVPIEGNPGGKGMDSASTVVLRNRILAKFFPSSV